MTQEVIGKYTEFISSKLSEKYCYRIIYFISVILFSISWINQLIIGPNSFRLTVSAGALLTIIMLFFVPREQHYKEYRFNKIYLALILIVGISYLVNGLYFRVVGYLAIGIVFSVIVPVFHLSFSKGNRVFLSTAIANGVLTSFVLFTVIAVLFGPGLSVDQYAAFVKNPNTVGIYMTITIASSSYLIYKKSYDGGRFYFEIICMGIAIAMCFFAQSRTSLLAILGEVTFMLVVLIPVYITKSERHKDFCKKFISILLLICLSTVLLTIAFYYTMTTVKKDIAKIIPNLQIKATYSDDVNLTTKKIVDLSESRLSKGIEKKNKDTFTSGRVTIWNDFYTDLSIIGHPQEGKDIAFKGRVYKSTNAHNVYLQVAYSAGIMAGISMIILMFIVIKDSFVAFFYHWKGSLIKPENVFLILTSIGFFVVSLTSGGYMLYTYCTATLFWLLLFEFTVRKE